jgi:hypothetical protein
MLCVMNVFESGFGEAS